MAVWSMCSAWRVPVLWILDQVQYDGPCHHASALWIPAYAGMTVRPRPLPLWIADQVCNDVVVVVPVRRVCSQ